MKEELLPLLIVFGVGSGRESACGEATGAPQVAQNLPDPISSAPHFAQFAMDEAPCWVTSNDDTSRLGRRPEN